MHMQIPVAVGVTVYEAYGLRTGKRVLSSKGSQQQSTLRIRQLLVYCLFGILAGHRWSARHGWWLHHGATLPGARNSSPGTYNIYILGPFILGLFGI
jgi:hypothetical protein